jgi:hypothetical protein
MFAKSELSQEDADWTDILECKHCKTKWDIEYEYCPRCQLNYGGAKYPETVTETELREAKTIILEIQEAFKNVKLDGGLTIHQAELEGAFTDQKTKLEARNKDPELFWWEVPDWKIENSHAALSFFDKDGFKFYMPAFMTWILKNGKKSRVVTTDCFINSLVPPSFTFNYISLALSLAQKHAVCRFLNFIKKYYPHTKAKKALEYYWSSFCQ